jgi:F-type H+-transporting ATPase subunit alpha
MSDNPRFAQLVADGKPTGEVIAVNRFLTTVRGLGEIAVNALVYFENGNTGMVREVGPEETVVLNLSAESMPIGTLAVLDSDELTTGVGEALIGRVVSVMGEPLDGKGPLSLPDRAPVFAQAPPIIARTELTDPLTTGVAIVDSLFPFCLGQRMAILGDGKTGKSAFMAQLTLSQKGLKRVVVHVLIGKRPADVDRLLAKLQANRALDYCIIIVASTADALTQAYIAPYVGAAIGEHLWQAGHDVVMIYDDLTSHAKLYREMSLLLEVSPGRDSYPGDMFFAHSSLLERAGRLKANKATLSAMAVVLTPADDITAHLPTDVMSITDGQIIFDADSFRQGVRPAVNAGLSVTRVGGKAQTPRQQKLTGSLFKAIASYRQAMEFSRFGTELAPEAQAQLDLGKKIYEALKQPPDVIYSPNEQLLILETIMKTEGKIGINVDALKRQTKEMAATLSDDASLDVAITRLLEVTTVHPVAPPAPAPVAVAAPAVDDKKKKKEQKK